MFRMVDDQPYLNPVGISLPEFQKLWKADKSESKSQYAKELAYVFHMCDFDSPYFDMMNKEEEVAKSFMGSSSYKPPKRVKDCIALYMKLQSNAERRALDAAVILCDSITDLANKDRTDAKQLENTLKAYDKEIDKEDDPLVKLAMIKEKLEIKKQVMDLANVSTNLISKLDKNIESLVQLRVKVIQASYTQEDNSTSISNFLIEDLIDNQDR